VPRNRISVGPSRRNDAAGVSAVGTSEAPFAQVPGILGLPATILQTDAAGQDNTNATGLTTLVRREPSVSEQPTELLMVVQDRVIAAVPEAAVGRLALCPLTVTRPA